MLKPTLGSQLQLGHPLACGLVGLWLLNEGSGDKVFDLSCNGNTGTFAAGAASPSWVSGKFGPAISFDGSDCIIVADSPSLDFGTGPITISIWVKTSGDGMLLDKGFTTGNPTRSFVRVNLGIIWAYFGGDPSITGSINVDDGIWHHIVVIRKGTLAYIYVDNVLDTSGGTAQPNLTNADVMAFGARSDGADIELTGQLDIPVLYNRALSVSEIAQVYREPFCMFERDPIELWSAATQGGAPPAGIPIFRRRIEAA